jgi:hypothetical protein
MDARVVARNEDYREEGGGRSTEREEGGGRSKE